MAQMIRCPLTGVACGKSIEVLEKTFFLAEPKGPEDARKRRAQAINLALGDEYRVRSALEEKQPCAFTCKICEMIQGCSYGLADLTGERPNVVLELGMMIALGKPVIMLRKKGEKEELELPSDVRAIEAIPFDEYIDIVDELKKMAASLLPPVSPPTPIADIEKLKPMLAKQMRKELETVVEEFDRLIKQAKLETILAKEERAEIPPTLESRLDKLEESLKRLERLGFTTDAKTAFYRGNFYYEKQEYEAALEQYDWALTLKPDRSETLNNRALTYDHLERYDEALADYNRALDLKPDDPKILNNRGGLYYHLKHYEEALADVNHALQLKPDYPEALTNRGNIYDDLKCYDKALADCDRALQLRSDFPEALTNRGATYSQLRQYKEALADFEKSLQLRPDHPGTIYNMACLFSLMRKPEEAISYLEKAIALGEKFRQDAATDSDFDNIRDDPRFRRLIE